MGKMMRGFMPSSCTVVVFAWLCIALAGCGPRSQKDYLDEGQRVSQALIKEMRQIGGREDLVLAEARVSQLYAELVDLMITAREYHYEHPDEELLEVNDLGRGLSRQLQREVERIRSIEGGAEWLERCQEDAVVRLAAFEGQLLRRRL